MPTPLARLVAGIGMRKISVIGLPGALTAAEYEALGVARISYGPMTQNVALTSLAASGRFALRWRCDPVRHREAELAGFSHSGGPPRRVPRPPALHDRPPGSNGAAGSPHPTR